MNLVGKIFTVLIFVMSLVFASFCVMVYGAHVNWRDLAMNPRSQASAEKPLGLTYKLEDSKAENVKLQNQLTKTLEDSKRERDSSRKEVTNLETTSVQQQERLRVQDVEIARLTALEREANATIEAIGASLANLRGEVALLRQTLGDTETDLAGQFDQLVRITDKLHAKANEHKVLLEQSARLTSDYAKARDLLRLHDIDPHSAVDTGIPPTVPGKVLEVRASGLIEISIGSDDGLAVGHELHVYRVLPSVNTYLGKVRVTDIWPDTAVCRILPEYRKGAIRVGDDVATKLSTGS